MAEPKNQLMIIHSNLEKLLQAKREALPKNFNQTRFLQNCMVVLQDTRNIEKMQPTSVARTMLKGAFLDLDFFRKECYAIPYADQLNFQTDYKGELKLAKKYSLRKIKDIYAKLVRKGDVFEETVFHGQQVINFKPLPFSNAEIVGAFAICYYEDGTMIYETMSTEDIENVKERYAKKDKDGKYSKAWRDSKGEMYKKTVLRRLTKLIEFEFDNYDQEETYIKTSDVEFDEPEFVPIQMPVEIKEQKKEIKSKNTQQPANGDVISEAQRKRMFAIANKNNISMDNLKALIAKEPYNYDSSKDIKKSDYDSICSMIEAVSNEHE